MPEIISYVARLKQDFQEIENHVMELLDISTIEEFRNEPGSGIIFITPPYEWGDTNEQQKILQMQLVKDFADWIEHFRLLFGSASQEISQQIEETQNFVISWIQKAGSWDVPSTIHEAKSLFQEKVQVIYRLLNLLETNGKKQIIVVPDTNSLIAVPDPSQYASVAGQSKYTMTIVPTVLAELDQLKVIHREPEFREKVNSVIKRIKGFRTQGSLLTGVIVNRTVTVRMIATEPDFSNTLSWLNHDNKDDRIIASVLEIQRTNPASVVVLATSDINLQNKAEMADLPFAETPVT
jgi:rRNA-processing protein FCF1